MSSKKDKSKSSRDVKIVTTTKAGPSLDRARVVGSVLATDKVEAGMTALARGTDALVARVVSSARDISRDPGDHDLNLSKAYYREEAEGGKQHSVQCDRCGLKSPGAHSEKAAMKRAEAAGWVVTDDCDHCPVCKDGSLLLNSGGAALAATPRLSHSDAILITRLRYIGAQIAQGLSVAALLQNSVRSQHRPMLSDLALETNYDPLPLRERVLTLIQKNADIHPVFLQREFGSDEPEKSSWRFVGELFLALREEDRRTVGQ